ncbi:MAG: COG3014 family protein [Chitinophagaceae bacterium]
MRFYLLFLVFLASCASYRQQSADYYSRLQSGDYQAAEKALDKNRLLNKKRNHLLYLLEKGKLTHMQGKWEESNRYFNEADGIMESQRNSFGDIALGNLLNPMMKQYRAEAFEAYLVHYYKAVNYLQLGNREEAIVEARRITLRTYMQDDKVGNKNKYSEDPFALSLQGMIYEAGGDINNAFIAYRNAANVYLESNGMHYGTKLPDQLKQDVLRLADANGFVDELQRYEDRFGEKYQKSKMADGGELLLFWESGEAPVKAQQDLFFAASRNSTGSLFFTDNRGLYNVPWDNSSSLNSSANITDLRGFRVAIPVYEPRNPVYSHAVLQQDGVTRNFELAENVNELAVRTLQERMLKELAQTLTRMAVKKLAEAAVRNAGSDSKDDKNKTEEEKKKEKKNKQTREALAFGLQLFNLATEKADTRNWQSLPNRIYYTRIPLQKGENQLTVTLQGPTAQKINLNVTGSGSLQFRTISSR